MMLYVNDNADVMPFYASRNNGWRAEDWIYWRTNDPAHPVSDSPVVKALGMKDPKGLFRCLSDRDHPNRTPYYEYSYTLNQWMGSSIGLAFKLSQVRNPSGKIMLAEEPSVAGVDSPPGINRAMNDGRWDPPNDWLTIRHKGKGQVNFADGHATTVDYKFATTPINFQPNL
jgi:prepilin-type processing-associated H-X9-DG protein